MATPVGSMSATCYAVDAERGHCDGSISSAAGVSLAHHLPSSRPKIRYMKRRKEIKKLGLWMIMICSGDVTAATTTIPCFIPRVYSQP